jgi:thiol-disulfide isomerase/thioredoxin
MSKKSKKESTLYYFTSTGCAFCKQIDPIVEKLNSEGYNILKLDESEKDNQGLHREIENKYDLRCGTPFLVDGSNGKNICGKATDEMVKKWVDGEEIPELPKPKTPPPPLPQNFDDENMVEKFKEDYNKWKDENNHLENLQSADQIVDRFKQQWEARKNQPKVQKENLDTRIQTLEQKVDKLLNHLGVK